MITLDKWLDTISEILSKRNNIEVKIRVKEGDNKYGSKAV